MLAALVLVLIASYQYGIRNTIEAYHNYKRSYLPEDMLQSKIEQYQQLSEKEKTLNKIIHTATQQDTVNADLQLLKQVTGFCNQYHLKLKNYSPYNGYQYQQLQVITNLVTVEGSFKQLLRFVNELEKSDLPARIKAMTYKTTFDNQQNTTLLSADIYLQQLQFTNSNSHESNP